MFEVFKLSSSFSNQVRAFQTKFELFKLSWNFSPRFRHLVFFYILCAIVLLFFAASMTLVVSTSEQKRKRKTTSDHEAAAQHLEEPELHSQIEIEDFKMEPDADVAEEPDTNRDRFYKTQFRLKNFRTNLTPKQHADLLLVLWKIILYF
jgi:hypothetical protein